jgi:hypothetical protein
MIRKKVKVFWPMDQSWYVGEVMDFDVSTGEHKLQYEDGDIEWVKIGDIMSAAAGMNANASNSSASLVESSSIRAPGHHDPMSLPPGVGQRQPMQQRSLSPTRAAQLQSLAVHRPPPHNPDHHRIEDEGTIHDYRSGSVPGQLPYGYGGHYAPVAGGQYPPNAGMPPGYSPNTQSGGQASQQGGPPPQHHPSMPPPVPPHVLSYGMYPPPGATGPYNGGPIYPPHPSVSGSSQYGVPPGVLGGMTSSYYSSGNGANSPSHAKDDDDDNNNNDNGRRKTGPKPWTKEEDTLLLNLVQ